MKALRLLKAIYQGGFGLCWIPMAAVSVVFFDPWEADCLTLGVAAI